MRELDIGGGALRCRRRIGGRHFEHASDAAQHRAAGAGLQVFIGDEARLRKCHMVSTRPARCEAAALDEPAAGSTSPIPAIGRQNGDGATPSPSG